MAYEGLLKAGSTLCEAVNIGSLDDGVSIAAKGADRLIVREEKDDVGLLR